MTKSKIVLTFLILFPNVVSLRGSWSVEHTIIKNLYIFWTGIAFPEINSSFHFNNSCYLNQFFFSLVFLEENTYYFFRNWSLWKNDWKLGYKWTLPKIFFNEFRRRFFLWSVCIKYKTLLQMSQIYEYPSTIVNT